MGKLEDLEVNTRSLIKFIEGLVIYIHTSENHADHDDFLAKFEEKVRWGCGLGMCAIYRTQTWRQ